MKRHDRDRRCRVATDRFQDLNLGLHPNFPHLLCDKKPVLVVRNDDRGKGATETLQPQYRVLKQGPFGYQRQDCFGRSRRDMARGGCPIRPRELRGRRRLSLARPCIPIKRVL